MKKNNHLKVIFLGLAILAVACVSKLIFLIRDWHKGYTVSVIPKFNRIFGMQKKIYHPFFGNLTNSKEFIGYVQT